MRKRKASLGNLFQFCIYKKRVLNPHLDGDDSEPDATVVIALAQTITMQEYARAVELAHDDRDLVEVTGKRGDLSSDIYIYLQQAAGRELTDQERYNYFISTRTPPNNYVFPIIPKSLP